MVIDDDGKQVGTKEEINIIHRVLAKVQRDYPLFTIRLIICSLKLIGKDHVIKMCEETIEGYKHTNLIVGYDMVTEEDYVDPIKEFTQYIKEH
jgi:hypothetical protein